MSSPVPRGRLAGKTVVVTGAALALVDRNAERVAAVAQECKDLGADDVTAIVGDLGDPEGCRRVADGVGEDTAVHGVVHAAAIFSTIRMKPFWEIDVAEWDALMAVNLRGPWLLTSALLPALRRAGGASIVNIGSDSVWQGREGYLHYVASKAGLLGLTFAMSHELGRDGIRVNTVSPAAVLTEVPRETVTEQQKDAMLAVSALKRFAGPADVAATVAYLLSDDAAFVTGQTLSVNGGLMHR